MARSQGSLRSPSGIGYYLGTEYKGLPYSRESVDYWPTKEAAAKALEAGDWLSRRQPGMQSVEFENARESPAQKPQGRGR